ncbi:MAG: hypothetical protein ACK5LX_11415 [Oscillospiraceae bacterium]
MKKRSQVLSLILCAVLVLSALAGCQPATDTSSGDSSPAGSSAAQSDADKPADSGDAGEEQAAPADFPTAASKDGKYDPGIKLSTVRKIEDIMQSKGLDHDSALLDDNLWQRDFRDILGIEIENQWSVPAAQYDEKMNAQIAANDLPDFYLVNNSQLKMVVDYGMATDMTDIFKEYACDFTNEMMETDNYVSYNESCSGDRLMALPRTSGNRDGANFFWIRKDWMDNLGIEEPKTKEEFIEMFRRFATDDPDGNGQDDTVGFGLQKELFEQNMGLIAIGESYQAYLGKDAWLMVDGKAEYAGIQPETKVLLESLAQMYQEGILDKEFIVKDSTKISEEIVSGKIGAFGGTHGQAFWPLNDVRTNNPNAMYVALSITSNDGEKAQTMLNGSASGFYVVNTNCENPEAVVKMYNYYFLKDPALSPEFDERYHGKVDSVEGWPLDEAYWWSPIQSWYPMQNLFIHMGVEDYFEKGDESPKENYWVADNIDQNQRFMDGDDSMFCTYIWSGPGDYSGQGRIHYYDQNDMFLQNAYTGPNTDAHVQFKSTLDQLRLETFTKIIMGETSIDEFDNFVTQWKSLGGDQITEQVNENLN